MSCGALLGSCWSCTTEILLYAVIIGTVFQLSQKVENSHLMQTRFPICVCLQSLWHTARMAKGPYKAAIKMLLLHKYNAATSFDVTIVRLSGDDSALCSFLPSRNAFPENKCLNKCAPQFFFWFLYFTYFVLQTWDLGVRQNSVTLFREKQQRL